MKQPCRVQRAGDVVHLPVGVIGAERPLVRLVGIDGAKPNLLRELFHVRLADADNRDEAHLGNWLRDGGEIKILLQVLLPIAESRD